MGWGDERSTVTIYPDVFVTDGALRPLGLTTAALLATADEVIE
jgi:hypothetical protein